MKKFFLPILLFSFLFSSVNVTAMEVVPANNTAATTGDPVLTNPAIKSALSDFKSMSRHDRKLKIKEVKKTINEYKVAKKRGEAPSTNTLLLVILAILLPPLAVYLHEGEINWKFWVDLLLAILVVANFLLIAPAILFALLVVFDVI